jgi:spore coat polysaccharide biosynthesis protein SpsF (cytidylyltransferase family)
MKIGIIIQARMSSRRLPGKTLLPLCGRPLLGHLLDSLRQVRGTDALLVATSVDSSDDPIAAFCAAEGLPCRRGPLDDVARRLFEAARAHGLDAFVRICGDSPLLDHRLVERAVDLFRRGRADLVTNVARRTFPKGQSVEVVRLAALVRALEAMGDPGQREHVTGYFYACPERFAIEAFESDRDQGGANLCVDTPEDRDRLEALLSMLTAPHWTYGWERLLALSREAS